MHRFFCYLWLTLIAGACKHHRYPQEVESSLTKARTNRNELEKVLNHYAEDSVKYEAACYLIANMDGHFANHQIQSLPDIVPASFRFVDSLTHAIHYPRGDFLPEDSTDLSFEGQIKKVAEQLLARASIVKQPEGKFSDLQFVKHEWLISHIDNAFTVWKTSLHAKNLSFDEFKQTLLTYRYREEALDVTSDFYREHLAEVLQTGQLRDMEKIVNRYNAYTFYTDCFEDNGKHLGNFGFYDILQFYQYECGRQSEWTARALNTNGIPTAFDFTTSWLDRNRHHYWVAVRDTTGRYRPFTPKWQALNDTSYFRRTSKVYRRTFDRQDNPYTLKSEHEEIPPLFNTPFLRDVSEQYHKVVSLSLPASSNMGDSHLRYLAVFSADGWKPVGWGLVNQKKKIVDYEKVPVDVVYITGSYRQNKLRPSGTPFFLDHKGAMHPITPDLHQTLDLHLTRKFHKKEDLVAKMKTMAGALLQGANKPDFSDVADLYTFSEKDFDEMAVKAVPLNDNKRYRYLRFIPLPGREFNLAVFEVYSTPVAGKPVQEGTSPYIFTPAEQNRIAKMPKLTRVTLKPMADTSGFSAISDGNMETFLTGTILETDLGTPTLLKQLRIAPRNANNGINVGDRYELLYYDREWKSAGAQTARSNYLIFPNIPANTLYWLKNLIHGKEEQAFTYEKGQQNFINHDTYTTANSEKSKK